MKKLSTLFLRSFMAIMLFVIFCAEKSMAQTPTYFKGTGTGTNTIPMNTAGSHCQQIYQPADFNTLPISGLITKIYFRNSAAGGTGTYTNFSVAFLQNSLAAFPSTTFLTGFTTALSSPSIVINGNATTGGWYEIVLTTPFLYDNTQTLICEIKYDSRTGGMSGYTTTAVGNKRLSIVAPPGPATGNLSTLWGDFGIDVIPATACTTPPTPGTATASPSTPICTGTAVNLNLTGHSIGTGQTYVWESAVAVGGPYTPISASSASSNFVVNPTASTFYRCVVTCSGNSQNSVPVQVVVNPPFPAGTYTINSAVVTGGTNYQTFADAVTAISCGIAGPVVFNVNATSGPYNEQISIPQIGGVSAVNTITFNGNGRTIQAVPVTGTRHLIQLNGADYITINNFNLLAMPTSTFGWGVHLTNGADNNTISNCNIDISQVTSTTQSNSAGIVGSGSNTSVTTAGNASNNTITGNTITGAYQGIILIGTATSLNALNNNISNNEVRNFLVTGIELTHNNGSVIANNNIHRTNRTDLGTTVSQGIELGAGNINCVVNANRIHNSHTAAVTQSGTFYGIISNGDDAAIGSENRVTNNLIYKINSLTGTQYGIYNTSSDGVFYYHNTIVLDEALSTAGITRGFFQTTLATNIQFRNNIVYVTRGGTGNKHCIFLATTTSAVVSNKNDLFINSPAGTNGVGTYGTTNYTTLIDWQGANANAYDQQSVSVDPLFANPVLGNYEPSAVQVNNIGDPVGVGFDINAAPRSATVPDPGAYEFNVVAGVNMGAESLVAPSNASGCYTSAETVTIRIRNYSGTSIDFSVNPVTVTTNVTGAVTQTLTAMLTSGTLGSGATMDVPMSATLNMTPTGLYTFNAFTTVAGDVNPANDAMPPANVTKAVLAAGTASASPAAYCITGGTPTLSTTGATGFGSLQWQQSTTPGAGFANIPGGTTNPYTVASAITQTMYYRLIASCNGINVTSNEASVALNNPQITGTTPGSACGPGPVSVQLAATGSGTTLNWYNVSTGGTAIGTGSPFNTPPISANTTYYVSASLGGSVENMPSPAFGTGTFYTATVGWGLRFTVNDAATINSVKIRASNATAGAASMQIRITDLADVNVYTGPVHNFTIGTTLADEVIPVNILVAPGNYKMVMTSTGINTLVREISGVTFPYTAVSNAISITAGANGAGTAQTTAAYYWFYDWVISTGCESARTAVLASITGPPSATISYAGSPYCSNAGTASVTQTGTGGGTYSSTAGLSINASTGAITLGTSTPNTYTVTYTIAATPSCPLFTTTTSVTISPNNTVTLSSAAGTDAQTVTVNTPITTITYATTGATGATVTGLPAGVTGNWAANVVTISGTPTATGTFNYTVTLTGGCGTITAAGTITVNPAASNTITLTSAAGTNMQTACVSTPITNITYSTTGATGATFSGLPAGVTGGWAANVVTISGTPTAAGPFSYTVTLTGGSGTGTATGTITVTPVNTVTLSSAAGTDAQTITIGASITTITYSTTGATGATVSGLPAGVTGGWAANVVTISGTPTAIGAFSYIVTLTGGCGTITENGSITVNGINPVPEYWNHATTTGGANVFPLGTNAATGKRVQWIVAPGEFGTPTLAPSGNVNSLWFWANSTGTTTFTNLTVRFANVSTTTFFSQGAFYTGAMTTSLAANITLTTTVNSWVEIPLTTPFVYDNTMNLVVEVSQCGYTGTGIQLRQLPYGSSPDYRRQYSDASSVCGITALSTGGDQNIAGIGLNIDPACAITLSSAPGTDNQTVCKNQPITNITYATTLATGATFSGLPAGVTGNWAANVVTITGTPTVSGVFNYTVTLIGCASATTATGTITVTEPAAATITYAGSPYCSNAGTANVTRTGTAGGTYTAAPAGLNINATTGAVTLGTSTAGTYTVTYTIAAGGGCPAVATSAMITITALPAATISYAGSPYCSSDLTAPVTRTGTAGGTYSSTAGLTINASTGTVTPVTSTPGTYTVTYTMAAGGGCPAVTATTTITITAAPNMIILYTGNPYCANGGTAAVTRFGTPGGTYSSTAGLIINATTGAVTLGTSTPGTYTVTYTVPASGGCGITFTTTSITITPAPSATIAYAGSPYCSNAGTANVTRTGTAGGTYSSTAGLTINAATGAVTLATSTAGTYTVTYTVAAAGGCATYTATTTITITALPAATISYAGSPFCSNAGTANVTRTGTAGGTYTAAPAGLTISATTGAVTPGTSTPGTYTVTYTIAAGGGCPAVTATTSITITALPAATIVYTGSPFCQNAVPGTVNVTRTGTAGGTYTAAPAGLTISATTGAVTLGTSTAGTYTVTYTLAAAGGCPAVTATATITVSSLSTAATAANASSTSLCGPGNVTLTVTGGSLGTGATWRWFSGSCGGTSVGTGASLVTNVTATTTYFVRAEGACNTTTCASVTVTVNTQPTITISASPVTVLKPYATTTLSATVTPATGTTIIWYRNGIAVPGATGTTLLIDVDKLGQYTARATSGAGCTALSTPVTITAEGSNQLFITPNPNNGQFKVRFYSNAVVFGLLRHVVMIAENGQKYTVKTAVITGPYSIMDIDARALPKGIYVIILTDAFGNEVLATGKVVIQ